MFWNCFDSVVFFYCVLELFRQCDIFLLCFGIVSIVWYFSIMFWNCFDIVVFSYCVLELFRHCGIFLLCFRIVSTVWYFSIVFWNCFDSVVFFYCVLELFRQCGIFCFSLLSSYQVMKRRFKQCHQYQTLFHCPKRLLILLKKSL